MGKKWQFVSNQVEDGAGKDERTRKIVRKTAMKAFRRNERMERAKRFMQEELGTGDPPTSETVGERAETSVRGETLQGPEPPGNLIFAQDDDTVPLSVDASSPDAPLPARALAQYPVASSFWPQEIVSLDPFGSSPLGTCTTWHFLFTHCQ
jgi:hypothetical protein